MTFRNAKREASRSTSGQLRCLIATNVIAPFVTDDARLIRQAGWDVRLVDGITSYAELGNAFRAYRPDATISWFAHRFSLRLAIACRLRRVPHHCIVSGFDSSALDALGYGNLRPGWRRWYTLAVFHMSTTLLPVSTTAAESLDTNTGGAFRHKTVPIPHSIPTIGWIDRPRTRVIVSAFYANENDRLIVKGFDRLVDLAKLLPAIQFVHFGGAPDAAEITAPSNLNLRGAVSNETLRAELFGALAYLQPSRFESFGFAAAEAVLAGCTTLVFEGAGHLPHLVAGIGHILSPDLRTAAKQILVCLDDAEAESNEVRQTRADTMASCHAEATRTLGLAHALQPRSLKSSARQEST